MTRKQTTGEEPKKTETRVCSSQIPALWPKYNTQSNFFLAQPHCHTNRHNPPVRSRVPCNPEGSPTFSLRSRNSWAGSSQPRPLLVLSGHPRLHCDHRTSSGCTYRSSRSPSHFAEKTQRAEVTSVDFPSPSSALYSWPPQQLSVSSGRKFSLTLHLTQEP